MNQFEGNVRLYSVAYVKAITIKGTKEEKEVSVSMMQFRVLWFL